MRGLYVFLFLGLTACHSSSSLPPLPDPSTTQLPHLPVSLQCGKDTDCKGDRVCEQGQCVTPTKSDTASTIPPPPSPIDSSLYRGKSVCRKGDARLPIPVWKPRSIEGSQDWETLPQKKMVNWFTFNFLIS